MAKIGVGRRVRERVITLCNDEPRTKQQFKHEVDINNIVARFTRSNGVSVDSLLAASPSGGFWGDFSDVADLRTMYERLANAEEGFMSLPAKVRKQFDNDALLFMEFVSNDENLVKLKEMLGDKPTLTQPTPSVSSPEAPRKEG